jgi:hypothetical protein
MYPWLYCVVFHVHLTAGCIDGDTEWLLYIHVCTSMRPEIPLELYKRATETSGVPSRLRIDRGTENTLVAEYQLMLRGPNRGSVLAGPSVHNQRIER